MSNIAEGLRWWDLAPPRLGSAQVLDYEYSWRCVCAVLHYTFCLPATAAAAPFSVSPCSSPPPHPLNPSINMQRHIELCLSSTSRASHVLADMHEDEPLDDTNLVNWDSIRGKVALQNLNSSIFSCVFSSFIRDTRWKCDFFLDRLVQILLKNKD